MDIERVADANEPTTKPRRAARKKRTTYTVAFRLDAFYVGILERGAAEYGISVHEYARQRLVELLERQDEIRLLEGTTQTRAAVFELREDLAKTLEVLLVNLTSASPDAVRAWISQNLRKG